jgi:hypothetical protein
MYEKKTARKILAGKPGRNKTLGRSRPTWLDNIETDVREIGCDGLDSSGTGKGPVEGSCEHDNEPSGCIKCWKVLEYLHN